MLKQHQIKIEGKDYTVTFPNVGQLMEIESTKLVFSKNKYIQLSMSDLKTHSFILDVVDSISYLSVLIPSLKDDLGIKNWNEMDALSAKKIVHVYRKQFVPWFLPILNDLYAYDDEQHEAKE